jgi:hypothetical protein
MHFDGTNSTGELLIYFCSILTIIGAVMFTVCFSLQEKYKDEVIKMHSEGFDWENEPIDGQAVYASGGGKAHGHLDAVYCFNFANARYMTLLLFFFFFKGMLYSMEWLTRGRQCRRREVHRNLLVVLHPVSLRYTWTTIGWKNSLERHKMSWRRKDKIVERREIRGLLTTHRCKRLCR